MRRPIDSARAAGTRAVFCFPGDLDTPTGGYRYDRRIITGSDRFEPLSLPGAYPFPDGAQVEAAARAIAAIADRAVVVVDGLALGALPRVFEAERERLVLVGLVHHPLHLETGLGVAARDALAAAERQALRAVRRVVVTSAATIADVVALGVAAADVEVIEPGTDLPAREPPATSRSEQAPLRLLCVASVVARKGHLDLLDALALVDRAATPVRWQLTCVGSLERDPALAARVLERAAAFDARVTFVGDLDETALAARYVDSDLFVLASRHEGFGMVLTEAIAHGLPIVATRAGAIAGTVGAGDADCPARLVEPGDVDALAAAIGELLRDRDARERLALAAQVRRARLSTWTRAIERFESLVDRLRPQVEAPAEACASASAALPVTALPNAVSPDAVSPNAVSPVAVSADAASAFAPAAALDFDAGWLALREPFDQAARQQAQTGRMVREAIDAMPGQVVTGIDLGGGTGSHLRFLIPAIGATQRWHLLDRDPALLTAAAPAFENWCRTGQASFESHGHGWLATHAEWDARIEPLARDLRDPCSLAELPACTIVAASALLDLVSLAWFESLLAACARGKPTLVFSMSYDGRIEWGPALPADEAIRLAMNDDQRRDKGFGPAMGPECATAVPRALAYAGYTCRHARSDWTMKPGDRAMQRRMIDDFASIALRTAHRAGDSASGDPPTGARSVEDARVAPGTLDSQAIARWRAERIGWLEQGRSHLRIGHVDVVARPGKR